jgi:hypothetical protein
MQEMATLDEVAVAPGPLEERDAGAPMPYGFA